eukprot:scaffold2268_cov349-Prasinococcus_capsulatus_cf.AAC.2
MSPQNGAHAPYLSLTQQVTTLLNDELVCMVIAPPSPYHITLVDEKRHLQFGTRNKGDRLRGIGCSVTLDAWVGPDNLQGHVLRALAADNSPVPFQNAHLRVRQENPLRVLPTSAHSPQFSLVPSECG